jgi:hypothetical protein
MTVGGSHCFFCSKDGGGSCVRQSKNLQQEKAKFFMLYDKRTFRFTAKQRFPELDTSDPPLKFKQHFFFSNLFKNSDLEISSQIYMCLEFSVTINALRSTALVIQSYSK